MGRGSEECGRGEAAHPTNICFVLIVVAITAAELESRLNAERADQKGQALLSLLTPQSSPRPTESAERVHPEEPPTSAG
eukprot:COSAG05_NODE_7421_length_812_cov_0.795518_1_plen_79_part_00